MIRVLTWNIGSFSFLKYAKYLHLKYKGFEIEHEYFQPHLTGNFVSKVITDINPDVLFLQEFHETEDTEYVEALKNYPHQCFISPWYHDHAILVASRIPFELNELDKFSSIILSGLNIIPVHLHSFSPAKRLQDATLLEQISQRTKPVIILGDTNIWSHGTKFLFKEDREAYAVLGKSLKDGSKNLFSTSYFGAGLDKVFTSSELKISNITCLKKRSHFMDHYPVFFDLEI
ncbi:MAG: endonuclease/exonuclease/phosphatase family protein [Candidatus Pacebacteria bacterium]|nr:endonuclease/exonuclease/phosphatase family protein [Candidatus Paceibacterota bacterium]MBP9851476.1 endonuclease/exonuclease/phosphatase family protein [Candidatus Paceibacterota bacterium]